MAVENVPLGLGDEPQGYRLPLTAEVMMRRIRTAGIYVLLGVAACSDGSSPPIVTSILIEPSTVELEIGESRSLTATVLGASGEEIAVDLRWASSDPGIVGVDQAGRITGISEGLAEIEAAAGGIRRTVDVEVLPGCRIDGTPSNLDMLVGDTVRIGGHLVCPPHQNGNVGWATTDANVAVVDSTSRVTSKSPGRVSIIGRAAADPSVTVSLALHVLDSSSGVSVLTQPSLIDVAPEQPLDLLAEVTGTTDTRVTWRTLDPSVVEVDETGRATALRRGTGYVVAISQADTTSRDVTTVRVSRDLAIVPGLVEIPHGQQTVLRAYPPAGVQWSSENPLIAAVDSSGVVSALFPGSVTITARSAADSTVSSTATVAVVGAEGPIAIERVTQSGSGVDVDPTLVTGILDVELSLETEPENGPVATELVFADTVVARADYAGGTATLVLSVDTRWFPSGLYSLIGRVVGSAGELIARTPDARLTLFHRNLPPAIGRITAAGTDSAVDLQNVRGAIDVHLNLDHPVDAPAAAARWMLDGTIAGEHSYMGGPAQVVFTVDTTTLQNGEHDLWPLVVDADGRVIPPPGPLVKIVVAN